MSLTIADENGEILAQQFGAEYQRSLMEKASSVRGKAGLWAALMFGMEQEVEEVFGTTRCIIRVHSNANLIIVPFRKHHVVVTFLTKKDTNSSTLLAKITPVLNTWK
jgi:hypothetical protein